MCGIAGFLNNEISSDQINSNISSMLNGIHHRGPDRNDLPTAEIDASQS